MDITTKEKLKSFYPKLLRRESRATQSLAKIIIYIIIEIKFKFQKIKKIRNKLKKSNCKNKKNKILRINI